MEKNGGDALLVRVTFLLMFRAIDSRLNKEWDIPPCEQHKTHKPARCGEVDPPGISGRIKLRCDDTEQKANIMIHRADLSSVSKTTFLSVCPWLHVELGIHFLT
jgi:hypothetical protein